jgi:hypothetical protein
MIFLLKKTVGEQLVAGEAVDLQHDEAWYSIEEKIVSRAFQTN